MAIKIITLAMSICLAATAVAQKATGPEIRYESIPNPIHLPADTYLGEAAGVALNSKGHIFVFTRSRQTRLFEFATNGDFIREIGKDLYGFEFAHTVRIDKDDNIWAVDEGANMVIVFNPAGRVIMTFGRKPETVEGGAVVGAKAPQFGDWATKLFNRPTDVAWDKEGNSYFADGYANSRVVKYDKDGKWVKAWGEAGTGIGQFHIVHSIATDAAGKVYVGDRENNRIQVFDGDGKFLKQFTNIGAPWALCITPGPKQYLYTSDSVPGRIFKMDLDGNILGVFGKPGKKLGEFGWIHQIACPTENTLYVAEILNWRVQKLTLYPGNH